MCTKLKRAFAGFCSCLVIFSVCVPAFLVSAEAAVSVETNPLYSVCFMGPAGTDPPYSDLNNATIDIPLSTRTVLKKRQMLKSGHPLCVNFRSAGIIGEPFVHTLYWYAYPAVWDDASGQYFPADYVGGAGIQHVYLGSHGTDFVDSGTISNVFLTNRGWACRATIPAANDCWRIYVPGHPDNFPFRLNHDGELRIAIDFFEVINTGDPDILAQLDKILAILQPMGSDIHQIMLDVNALLSQAKELNINVANILSASNKILTELKSQHVDIRIIKSLMDGWTSSDGTYHLGIYAYVARNLPKLVSIDKNVDAIYYVLTEALKSETAQMDKATADVVTNINNQHEQEVYWQTNAQQSYDALDMGNFTFGSVTGGISLVGKIFSDIFDVFGAYKILFTFPLLLAIALLVIGKISRSSRGKGGDSKDA